MAIISVYIPDNDVSRVYDAVCAHYNYQVNTVDENGQPVPNPQTKAEFTNGIVRGFLSEHLHVYELEVARAQAEAAAAKAAAEALAAQSAAETEGLAEIEIQEGESLEEVKARMAAMKPKKQSISADLLNTANSYDDKVALIRMIVAEDSTRVAGVLKSLIVQ